MNIRFNGTLNSNEDVLEKILDFHGLSREWLKAGKESLYDGSQMRNFNEAFQLLEKHALNKVVILIDNDTDGFTSAATIFQWLKITYPNMQISYAVGEGKVHGIIEDTLPKEKYDLLIIPDASSSEIDKHKMLVEQGIDILILD